MEYDLYHDESQEEGYWHGILLMPRTTRDEFLEQLNLIRKEAQYYYPINLKRLNVLGRKFNCIKAWNQLGAGALMQYFKNEPYIISVGKHKYSIEDNSLRTRYKELFKIDSSSKIIGAKFILFKERDSHSKMGNKYPDFASKVETTFRMSVRGGMHWLGSPEDPIHIKSIHFDGYKHYRRNINKERIIDRIYGLRDYCSFDENIQIDDNPSKHTVEDCQNYNDCQFLQLTDVLIGAFRTVLGCTKNEIQKQVAHPVNNLISKWQQGYPRMKNSRWFRGFWMGECWIENEKWKFDDFRSKEEKTRKLL